MSSETAINVSHIEENGKQKEVISIAYNETIACTPDGILSGSCLGSIALTGGVCSVSGIPCIPGGTPCNIFNSNDVCSGVSIPGSSILGWSVSCRSGKCPQGLVPGVWKNRHLFAKPGVKYFSIFTSYFTNGTKFNSDFNWAHIAGDPAITHAKLSHENEVFLSNLAISALGPGQKADGICVMKSSNAGIDFEPWGCVRVDGTLDGGSLGSDTFNSKIFLAAWSVDRSSILLWEANGSSSSPKCVVNGTLVDGFCDFVEIGTNMNNLDPAVNHPILRVSPIIRGGENYVFIMFLTKKGSLRLITWDPGSKAVVADVYVNTSHLVAKNNIFFGGVDIFSTISPKIVKWARPHSFDIALGPNQSEEIRYAYTYEDSFIGSCGTGYCSPGINCSDGSECVSLSHIIGGVCTSNDSNGKFSISCSDEESWDSSSYNSNQKFSIQYNPEIVYTSSADSSMWMMTYKTKEHDVGNFICKSKNSSPCDGRLYCANGSACEGAYRCEDGTVCKNVFSTCPDGSFCNFSKKCSNGSDCENCPETCVPTRLGDGISVNKAELIKTNNSSSLLHGPINFPRVPCPRDDGYWGDYDGLAIVEPPSKENENDGTFITAFTDSTVDSPTIPIQACILRGPLFSKQHSVTSTYFTSHAYENENL